jgi:NAD(P)-dependent dehydrogenase (short-subunit alcohol dehydrogenase family)
MASLSLMGGLAYAAWSAQPDGRDRCHDNLVQNTQHTKEIAMLLQNKNAVIYGGGGAIGGAVARAFSREGANVFLAGRTLAKLDQVTREISAAGGMVEAAEVDALDEKAIDKHADAVAAKAGGIDIALNAVGILHVQGTPFAELSFQDYTHPITAYTRTNVLTVKAVARHMVKRGAGVILTLSTPGSRMPVRGFWATA